MLGQAVTSFAYTRLAYNSSCGTCGGPPVDPVIAMTVWGIYWGSIGFFALWPAWLIFGLRFRALLWAGLFCFEFLPYGEPAVWLLKDEKTFQLVSVMAVQMALLIGVRQRPSLWIAAKLAALFSVDIILPFWSMWVSEVRDGFFIWVGVKAPETFLFEEPIYAAEFFPQVLLGAFLAWWMPPEKHWRRTWRSARSCRRFSLRPLRRRRPLVLARKTLSSPLCRLPIPPPPS